MDAIEYIDRVNATSYPPLSTYMRTKVRLHMTASRTWVSMYQGDAAPCELCPPTSRLATRTSVGFSYRIGPHEFYRVCYKCMSHMHLRREREQKYAELRVYAPIRAQRAARVRQAEQRTGFSVVPPCS